MRVLNGCAAPLWSRSPLTGFDRPCCFPPLLFPAATSHRDVFRTGLSTDHMPYSNDSSHRSGNSPSVPSNENDDDGSTDTMSPESETGRRRNPSARSNRWLQNRLSPYGALRNGALRNGALQKGALQKGVSQHLGHAFPPASSQNESSGEDSLDEDSLDEDSL